jgi:hypothetical protein
MQRMHARLHPNAGSDRYGIEIRLQLRAIKAQLGSSVDLTIKSGSFLLCRTPGLYHANVSGSRMPK